MRAKQLGKTLNSRELNSLIHPLRFLDNHTNLWYLLADYAALAVVLGSTIAFCHNRAAWGIAWYWTIPVVSLAVVLIGALQHRLAGLGHEGAHYILFKNRVWNELASDLFCMFPVFATTEQYRQIHLGHHEFTNDWERDPELLNLGKTRMMDCFPMTRWQFFFNFGARLFWPPTMFRYMWDNIYVTALGKGVHPYMDERPDVPMVAGQFRLTSVLGVLYIIGMVAGCAYFSWYGTLLSLAAFSVGIWLAACAVIAMMPSRWFFASRLRPIYSNKITSALRLGWVTALEFSLAWPTQANGFEWGVYFWLLWMLPIFTTFPYLMLIRDLFQHANADDGKLTNSRVALTNPVVRWAMFVYGQDVHLTHHLYPAVPHYRLWQLHALLKDNNAEYAENVVECFGAVWSRGNGPTLLEELEKPFDQTLERSPGAAEIDVSANDRVEAACSP